MSERKVAAVFGVGPGLGLALAERLAGEGLDVAILARRQEELAGFARQHGEGRYEGEYGVGRLAPIACDVADPASVAEAFGRIEQELAPPDCVVFNAGTFMPAGILEIDPADFERCWRVGCLGGLLVGQEAARRMVERGHGTLLFSGATASLRGSARFANLAVPKFGLRALAQSMARELGPRNIHVAHVIIDGQIESERYRKEMAERPPDAFLKPVDIAEMYVQLYRQPRSAWTFELDLRPWAERF